MRKEIRFTLNGSQVAADVTGEETAVEVLQREFRQFGVRESCGQGLCGACTIWVDGRAVSSCLMLASFLNGTEVTTIEGLSGPDGELHPLQKAFLDCDAFQCGFCTPGMIMTAAKLLEENPHPDEEAIRHYLSGNLCRCGTYPEIFKAVAEAAEKMHPAAK